MFFFSLARFSPFWHIDMIGHFNFISLQANTARIILTNCGVVLVDMKLNKTK